MTSPAPIVPLPASPLGVPWWRIESLPWDMASAVELDVVGDPKFTDTALDVGGAGLELLNTDDAVDAFEAAARVVRYSVLDLASSTREAPVYRYLQAAVMDRPTSTVIASTESKGETTQLTGRTILAQLAYSKVGPPAGNGEDPATDRWWNCSHRSIDIDSSPWVAAVARSIQGSLSTAPPNGLNGYPLNFSNPLASWLSSRVASGADPDGVFLLAYDFTLAEQTQTIWDATADDAMQVWVDERPLGDVWDYPDGDAAGDTYRGVLTLDAGPHRVVVPVGNFPRPGNDTNCGLFVMAVTKPEIVGGLYTETTLFTTSSPGWRALDYDDCEPVPGPEVGQVLVDLWEEMQDREENTWWSCTFGRTLDSAGQPWALLHGLAGFSQKIGTDYVKVLDALVDAGWIEYDATLDEDGLPVLHCWQPLGAGSTLTGVGFARAEDLAALEYQVDHSGQADKLLVSYANGLITVGSGARSEFISVDAVTRDEAVAKAEAVLESFDSLRSITAEVVWTDQAVGPYFGMNKLDTVDAINRKGEATPARIIGWNVSADGATGRPVYRPILVARRHQVAQRQARTLARLGLGTFGGRTAAAIPVTSRQRPMEGIGLIQMTWNVPGDADELASGFVPPEREMRLNRLLVTAKTGTGSTRIRLEQNSVNVGQVTIGAGTPVEAIANGLASILRTTQRVQCLVGADGVLGAHEDLVIIAYGGPLGVAPVRRQVRS